MSDDNLLDEDTPVTSLHTHSQIDHDPSEETPDFRLLANLVSKSSSNPSIPRRGEKDFEPHGTKHQDGILEASRQAMHDALGHTRIHGSKNWARAWWFGEEDFEESVMGQRIGLDEDHIVAVPNSKGPHFRGMGKSNSRTNKPLLWLLPEEALYLIERGNLDIWWPNRGILEKVVGVENKEGEVLDEDEDEGTPLSLQAAYVMLIGEDGERGKVSLDRYTVFANLKRMGYIVMRAPDWDPTKPAKAKHTPSPPEAAGIFSWLWGQVFAEKITERQPYGPLVKPGMYRSYNSIYRQLAIIPTHKPLASPLLPAPPPQPLDPYRVIFYLWKPTRLPTFTKSNPPDPDFRIAVTNSRESFLPTLGQVTSLLESTPWDPPSEQMAKSGPGRVYQRIKHGWRNVVLAVVDQGVISFLRLGETAFGDEPLFEGFDQAGAGVNKGGGGRGRGRGRGRGGGRGRGS